MIRLATGRLGPTSWSYSPVSLIAYTGGFSCEPHWQCTKQIQGTRITDGSDSWRHDVRAATPRRIRKQAVQVPLAGSMREMAGKWKPSTNPCGKNKKASPFEVAKRDKSAWDSIDKELVRRSFLTCCISNSVNGFEDDVIRETRSTSEDTDSHSELSGSEPGTNHEGVVKQWRRINSKMKHCWY